MVACGLQLEKSNNQKNFGNNILSRNICRYVLNEFVMLKFRYCLYIRGIGKFAT